MKPHDRAFVSLALVLATWVVLLTGWPSPLAACAAGALALVAVLLAPT